MNIDWRYLIPGACGLVVPVVVRRLMLALAALGTWFVGALDANVSLIPNLQWLVWGTAGLALGPSIDRITA